MTRRKPPKVSFRWWVDRQIGEAHERGEFNDLPGTGKPLPKPTGNDAATDWVLRQVRAGGHDTKALLPPALALRREVQDLPARSPASGPKRGCGSSSRTSTSGSARPTSTTTPARRSPWRWWTSRKPSRTGGAHEPRRSSARSAAVHAVVVSR